MWRWLYGPFEINWCIALLPNPIIFESFVNKTLMSIKADKNLLSSLASSDVMMEFVSSRDFFYVNSLLQVEFRAIFEPFSYILLNWFKT